MPAIVEKKDCLKGCVFRYEGREGYIYREYNPDTQRYTSKKIKGAVSIDDAVVKALEVFTDFRHKEANPTPIRISTTEKSSTPYSRMIEPLLDEFLVRERKRAEVGIITMETFTGKETTLDIHLRGYLKERVITRTHQIKATTFDEYPIYRAAAGKLTRNKEMKDINTFLKWCLRNEYLHPKLASEKLLPLERVTEEDLTSNPAINPHDWELITKQLRSWRAEGDKHTNPKTRYWRALFHHFCLVMKQTGMRPVEIRNLRWSDIEFLPLTAEEEELRRSGRMSSSLTDKVATCYIYVRKSKTKTPREVPAKCGRELRRWKDYLYDFIKATGRTLLPSRDDLVFGNCDHEYKSYAPCFFNEAWQEAVKRPLRGKLRGHAHSDKEYTMYSMRSTFIEDNLLQEGGCDVFYLARVCGHDVKILQRHYERIQVRSRASELRQIPFGKHEEKEETTTYLIV
jgi:integrase